MRQEQQKPTKYHSFQELAQARNPSESKVRSTPQDEKARQNAKYVNRYFLNEGGRAWSNLF